MGFEPMTFSLEGEDTKVSSELPLGFHVDKYREFLYQKYSRQYASMQFGYSLKHFDCLINPSELLSLPESKRRNVLKAIVCLSKYLGCYEVYKSKLKNYGIKWSNGDTAFNGFLAIFNHKHDTLGAWVQQITPSLHSNERLFLRFLTVTGLRKIEGVKSFNLIIQLNIEGNLDNYYNRDASTLEHFKYGRLFLRGTKNAYISIVPKELINEICNSQRVSYSAIQCRTRRQKIKLRLKELRSYQNSYLRKNGIISELVDVLAGRVPKSVFCRHYLGADMKLLANEVLSLTDKLEQSLNVEATYLNLQKLISAKT